MPGEKLIALLDTLDKKEKQHFESFLNFNAPGKHKVLDLYKKLRHKKKDLNGVSGKLYTQLGDELAQYLAFKGLGKFTGLTETLAIREERQRINHWDSTRERRAKKALDQKGVSPETIFVRKLLSYEEAHFRAKNEDRGKHFELNIANQKLQLNRYYSLQMAVHLCEEAMIRLVKGDPNKASKGSDFEQDTYSIMEKTAEQWPLLGFYLETLEGLRQGKLMPLAVERFEAFEVEVATDEREFLWSLVFAQHSAAMNQGHAGVTEQVHDFLVSCIEKGYAKGSSGNIRESILKNLLETKVRLGRTKEAWEVLDRYRNEVGSGMLHLGSATIAFAEGDFHASMKHLYKVQVEPNLKDIYFGFGRDFLMAKNHFELGELDEVESYIARLKERLSKNKYAGEYHKDTLKDRLNFFRRLFNAYRGKGKQIHRLVKELESTHVDDRTWLLAKAKALQDAL